MEKLESQAYLKIDGIVEKIMKIMVYIGAAILIFTMLVAFCDVLAAKIFGSSIKYATEIITYCDVPLAYLGMAYTLLIGQMTSVDILFGKFSQVVQKALNMFYDVLGIGFCLFLGKLALDNVVVYYTNNTLSNPKGGFPVWPFVLIEAISWLFLAIAFLFCFLRYLFAPSKLLGVTEKAKKTEEVEHMIESIEGPETNHREEGEADDN